MYQLPVAQHPEGEHDAVGGTWQLMDDGPPDHAAGRFFAPSTSDWFANLHTGNQVGAKRNTNETFAR
jgi:hypothetical protein